MITCVGEVLDPIGLSHRGYRIDPAELRSRQEGPIPLTLDHTQLAGEVLTLTRTRSGAVYAVAVAGDECDPFLEIDEPIYFSPTINSRATDGTDGFILDCALTLATSRVSPRPIELLAGDVRRPADRGGWPLRRPGFTADLIDRAVDELRSRPKDGPIHIRDIEAEKQLEEENRRRVAEYRYLPPTPTRDWSRVPPQCRPGWRSDSGAVEWSQHRGRVLSVR